MHSKKRLVSVVLIVAAALVAVLCVLQGAAAATTVFDGKVLAGYKYNTTTGNQFSIVSVAPLSKVAVDLPGESLIVENKSCSAVKKFQACYDGATFKGYNHSLADREVYEFRIKISLVAPEIVVVKILDKGQVDVGESTVVHVNITNAGAAQGTAYFSEVVPTQLKITELPSQACEISLNNTLTMIADLKDGELRHCDYKITALGPGIYTVASAVSYDIIKTVTATASATVRVNALPLFVVENISGNLLLGDPLNISLLLRPTASLGTFVLNTWVPSRIKVTSVNKEAVLARQNDGANVAYGDKTTSLDGDVRINISSQLAYVGTSVISINSSWLYNGLQQSLAKDILINATFGRPYLRVSRYDNNTGKLSMDVVNPAHLAIYNVAVIPEAAGREAAFSAGEIGSSGHASFSDAPEPSQAQQPSSDNSSQASYRGAIVYHTGYGQELAEPFSLAVNTSSRALAANNINLTEIKPPADQSEVNNATQGEITRKPKQPQGMNLMPAEIRTALVMVAIIIGIIVIFFMIRGRERGYSVETGSDGESREIKQ